MSSRHHDTVPLWSWLFPSLAALLLAAKFGGIVSPDAAPAQLVAAVLLLGAVFAAVHHAEVVALRLGEPFGWHCHVNLAWTACGRVSSCGGDYAAFRMQVSSCQTLKASDRISR
jgi:hypothetical protein